MISVLYVDDEPDLLEIAKLFLEEEKIFSVETLSSARVALERLKVNRYDAIISDYQMPEMNGIMFLKQLRASGDATPFIIFTGKGREEVVIEALNNGADFYIQKGGEPRSQFADLSNKIRHAVSLSQSEKALGVSEVIEKEMEYHENELIKFYRESMETANRKLTLLSGITRHDILDQLSVLQTYHEMLEKMMPDSSYHEYFKKMRIATNRISYVIRFNREYEETDVTIPVRTNISAIVEAARKDEITGDVRLVNDLPEGTEIHSDFLIANVFYTLMHYAARDGRKATTLRFSLQQSGGNCIILCEDDGEAIPAEDMERIFERGFGNRTGPGLFLVREILSLSGITIRVTGEPGSGARFEITVPKGEYRIA
ncbi:MAG: hybrid sensor histidine kinase/response regulator [Methanoregula sp.]|jgi:DNA-binding response OmpR family regulator|uniref:ATP-binding response regulator n=1 Tax=Methanoregula sp. TaxID=2052170 RepID=UPI003C25792B